MKKLNRTQKCSILGPQNLGSREGPGPWPPPPDPHLSCMQVFVDTERKLMCLGDRSTFEQPICRAIDLPIDLNKLKSEPVILCNAFMLLLTSYRNFQRRQIN